MMILDRVALPHSRSPSEHHRAERPPRAGLEASTIGRIPWKASMISMLTSMKEHTPTERVSRMVEDKEQQNMEEKKRCFYIRHDRRLYSLFPARRIKALTLDALLPHCAA